jgi:hypothetical protein
MRLSIAHKVLSIAGAGIALLVVVGGISHVLVDQAAEANGRAILGSQAIRHSMVIDMMHDGLRGSVFAALSGQGTPAERREEVRELAGTMHSALQDLQKAGLSGQAGEVITATTPVAEAYTSEAINLVEAITAATPGPNAWTPSRRLSRIWKIRWKSRARSSRTWRWRPPRTRLPRFATSSPP